MLTALNKASEAILALPDYEQREQLDELRERTRQGEFVCPTCRALLWLRAGQVLIPHFAHRRLSDCPHGRVSEALLAARRLLYRFFQSRMESGKLPAQIQLEPVLGGLPKKAQVDLLLLRQTRPSVAMVLVERQFKPDARDALVAALAKRKLLFRPVFLASKLKRAKDVSGRFLLDPTQRDWRQTSAYDLRQPDSWGAVGSLHVVDANAGRWTTLRGLRLEHEPQVFKVRVARVSSMDQLLWSEVHSEWVHPGEAEELKNFREAFGARKRQEAEERRKAEERRRAEEREAAEARKRARAELAAAAARRQKPPPPELPKVVPAPAAAARPAEEDDYEENEEPVESFTEQRPEPLPVWLSQGLRCIGCGQRTNDWQNANPGKDVCVCRKCFQAGIRLPG